MNWEASSLHRYWKMPFNVVREEDASSTANRFERRLTHTNDEGGQA